jgi:hypothetical protein
VSVEASSSTGADYPTGNVFSLNFLDLVEWTERRHIRRAGRLTGQILRYRASTCGPCPLKSKCCPNTPQRMVPRDVNEHARDHVRALEGTPAFEKSRNQRKKVEMRFAHLKIHHRFERMRT